MTTPSSSSSSIMTATTTTTTTGMTLPFSHHHHLAFAHPTSSRQVGDSGGRTKTSSRVDPFGVSAARRRRMPSVCPQNWNTPHLKRQASQFISERSSALFSSAFNEENNTTEDDDSFPEEIMDSLEDLLMDLDSDLIFFDDDDDDLQRDVELDESDFDSDRDVEELLSLLAEGEQLEDDDIKHGVEDSLDLQEDIMSEKSVDTSFAFATSLEDALRQGVVPASAGVGSECLPGDWDFDPLNFAEKDWILQTQFVLLQAMPGAEKEDPPPPRPTALILRDYREAEIRHGRLAMLAAVIWPLQEMLDRLILDADEFDSLLFGKVTLPYFPLLMTLIMMLLGYLDIYAKAIQEKDDVGDAFLPGDCFWDPLNMLEGAPASMKRNMQERELFNGRVAMLAFAAYVFEEATSRLPLILIKGNELLFLPAYQIPYIQEYLDGQFSNFV